MHTTHGTDWVNATDVMLAVSLELAAAKWKVEPHDRRRQSPSFHTVAQTDPAARMQAVLTLIATRRAGMVTSGQYVGRRELRSRPGCILDLPGPAGPWH